MNKTHVAAITSCRNPGRVISSVLRQPPGWAARSNRSTRSPFNASIAPATSALIPDPMMT